MAFMGWNHSYHTFNMVLIVNVYWLILLQPIFSVSPITLYDANSLQMRNYPIGSMSVQCCQTQEGKKNIFIGTMYSSGENLLNCSIKKSLRHLIYQIAWNIDCIFEVCSVKTCYAVSLGGMREWLYGKQNENFVSDSLESYSTMTR